MTSKRTKLALATALIVSALSCSDQGGKTPVGGQSGGSGGGEPGSGGTLGPGTGGTGTVSSTGSGGTSTIGGSSGAGGDAKPLTGGASGSGGTVRTGGSSGGTGGAATGGTAGGGGTRAGGSGGIGGSGGSTAGGTTGNGGSRTGGSSGGTATSSASGGTGGTATSVATGGNVGAGGATGGSTGNPTGGSTTTGLSLLTDTNRDGKIDQNDVPDFGDWAWKGKGAFFLANVDDDDKDGKVDATDQVVNGTGDEKDLARILIKVGTDALAKAPTIAVSMTAGTSQVRLFEKSGTAWKAVSGALSQAGAENELGIEATQFADSSWDGMAVLKVDLKSGTTTVESQSVKMRVAPFLLLPSSAKSEIVYMIGGGTGTAMRAGIDAVLQKKGLPPCQTPTPSGQDQWYQDTMEIGYTQLPGSAPMHVVMNSPRSSTNEVAKMLLAPDFGFISPGTTRSLGGGFGGDYWMDWMGNLEVTHPMPGYPFGRVYYGKSTATTFSPTIVKFLEAQELQKPFSIYTEWLVIQHVDETMMFVVDKDGKPKMIVPSPSLANDILKTGYDANQQKAQGYIDDVVATAKTELGITDADIVRLPLYFDGSGLDFSSRWTDPVNSIFVNGTFVIGKTDVPAAIKTNIESTFGALGIEVAWVDDANYQAGGGNVHCGTNITKTPPCADFTQCL